MTFGQLKGQVGLYANALRALGVKKGDRVVGYMPNCPEAIIGKFLHCGKTINSIPLKDFS